MKPRVSTLVAITIVVTTALAACSSGAPPTPKSSLQLHTLLLTTHTVPAGMNVASVGPVDDRKDWESDTSHRAHPTCDDLSATTFVFSGTTIQPVGNTTASVTALHNPGEAWFGLERLTSYEAGDAHQVLDQLRHLAARCPTDGNSTTTLAAGPKLGDESVDLVSTTAGSDGKRYRALLIRTGDNLIIIEEQDVSLDVQTPIVDVATAAYRVFTAASDRT